MKKACLLCLFVAIFLNYGFAQLPSNEAQIGITGFELQDGTWTYRTDNNGSITGFYDKTSWNSSPFLQGYLREQAGPNHNFRMNYRYLMPGGYDPNYNPGYPLVVMLHGAVERGNGWQSSPSNLQSYYSNKTWFPWVPTTGSFTATPYNNRNNLLNNDHQLLNGGTAHLSARDKAGTKKPNDPTLNPTAFPGFVLFPQMLNGWDSWSEGGINYKNDIYDMIRIVRLMIEKYNVDPNRIYIHGLSNGGRGVFEAIRLADWLFAAGAPMSAINTPSLNPYRDDVDAWSVPLWWFQGGKDGNPSPSYTEGKILELRTRGANIRYTKYASLGHGVWNNAYAEPDFWSWLLSKSKSDLFVAFGTNRICQTPGAVQPFPTAAQLGTAIPAGARLAMPREMGKYQWKLNGNLIAPVSNQIYVTVSGQYQGRFSRIANPASEADWNEWSKPVDITVSAPPIPTLTNTKSIMLPDLNNATTSTFIAPTGYFTYRWWRTIVNQPALNTVTMVLNPDLTNYSGQTLALSNPDPSRTSYAYRVRVQDVDGCYNATGPNKTVWYSLNAPPITPPAVVAHNTAVVQSDAVTGLTAKLNGPVDILLNWDNPTTWSESNFELWRATDANKLGTWTLIKILDANTIAYLDAGLSPGTRYHYKIRAISQTNTSPFAPGGTDKSITVTVQTTSDAGAPTTPQNLQALLYDTDIATKKVSVILNWSPSTDDYAVKEYRITYGSTNVYTGKDTTSIIIPGLNINQNYAFTVRALDNSNHTSRASQQVNINTKVDGLFYVHNTAFYTDMSTLDPAVWDDREFAGRVNNLDLSVATQDSYVLIKFYGYLYISTPGIYKFRTTNNDGVRVKLNDQIIIEDLNYQLIGTCPQTDMSPLSGINLPAGYIPIEVRYWQSEDDRCLTLEWQGTDAGDPGEWATVPNARLTTQFVYVPPVLPSVVTNLSVQQPYGIDDLTLNWTYTGPTDPAVSFEVYRATSVSGPFTLVDLASGSPYLDENLIPNTTYFYKLKSVSDNGSSAYGNVASGLTGDDTIAPTAPLNVIVPTTTLTSALVDWDPATDNVGVVAYRIYVTPAAQATYLAVTTAETFSVVTNLDPGITYDFYVVAVDAKGNVSPNSNVAQGTTQGSTAFFYRTNNAAVTSPGNWTTSPTGTGGTSATTTNFNADGNYFNLSNSTATPTPPILNGTWSIPGPSARVIIGNNVTLTTNGTTSGITANMELVGTAKLVLVTNNQPTLVALSESSTLTYAMASPTPLTTTVVQQIQQVDYGNLELTGEGSIKNFQPGTTTIYGDLTVGNQVAISGAPGNGSTIILYGDLIYLNNASPLFTSADNAVILDIRKPSSQQIRFEGQLNIHELKVSVPTAIEIDSDNGLAILILGSSAGGGLSLPAGASLRIGNDQTLQISGAGTINTNSETGSIIADGGSIEITSTSTATSNIYIDQNAPNRILSRLSYNGLGQARIWNSVNITDGLKVTAGSIVSNGSITLKSTSGKTANLEEMGEFGSVIGALTVERFVPAKQNTYRYLSASVAGLKILNWQAYFPISGNFTGANISSSPSLFVQAITPATGKVDWRAYPQTSPIKSNQAPIEQGKGYSAYLRNDSDFTMSLTGVPYQGPVPFTLFAPFTIGAYTFDGWNLIGNPYASTIQWSLSADAWSSKNAISNIIAVRENDNSTDGHFLYFDALTGLGTHTGDDEGTGGTLANGVIAPSQAFYVQTTGANPSLTINESAKFVGQQSLFRESADNATSHLRLTLKGNSKMDQTILALTNYATDEFEPVFDAAKRENTGLFNFSSMTKDGVATAINNLSNDFCDKTVRLSVQNIQPGSYTIELDSRQAFYGVGSLILKDAFADKVIDLNKEFVYTFDVTADAASYGVDRFQLVFSRPELSTNIVANASASCSTLNTVTLSKTQKGATYTLVDVKGAAIVVDQKSMGEDLIFLIPSAKLAAGVNAFQVKTSFDGCASLILPERIQIEYYAAPVQFPLTASTCYGSPASIQTTHGLENVVSFNWYEADGSRIKNFESTSMETSPIFEVTSFSVAPVYKNGCEGSYQSIVVVPEQMDDPELFVSNDTLFTNVRVDEYEWRLNGTVIATTTVNYLGGLSSGVYEVICKTGGCSKTSKEFSITGAEEEADMEIQYQLYPNPASSNDVNLRVISKDREDIMVKVVDVLGKEHYVKVFSAEELRNSVKISPRNEFRSGVYYMVLKQKDRFKEIKFIIKD